MKKIKEAAKKQIVKRQKAQKIKKKVKKKREMAWLCQHPRQMALVEVYGL